MIIDGLIVSHMPYGPTAYFALANCVLRHDIKDRENISDQYPHLIFHNFSTSLGERVFISLMLLTCVGDQNIEEFISCSQRR